MTIGKKNPGFTPLNPPKPVPSGNLTGFTLVEMVVVMAIISILASAMIFGPISTVTRKARDTKRKSDIYQMGHLLSSCYLPQSGAGEYDLGGILSEWKSGSSRHSNILAVIPRDPLAKEENRTLYYYQVDALGRRCLVYANLENGNEPVNFLGISAPTFGVGTGVFEGTQRGWNGSYKYLQASSL